MVIGAIDKTEDLPSDLQLGLYRVGQNHGDKERRCFRTGDEFWTGNIHARGLCRASGRTYLLFAHGSPESRQYLSSRDSEILPAWFLQLSYRKLPGLQSHNPVPAPTSINASANPETRFLNHFVSSQNTTTSLILSHLWKGGGSLDTEYSNVF